MTDTVINSASVIFGSIPTVGRHRLSCGGRLHLIVDPDVQCGREGVQIDVHVASMVSLPRQRRSWTPSLLPAVPYPLESII